MEQSPLPPLSGRKDRTPLILAGIVCGVTVLMLAMVFFMMGGSETPSLRFKGGSAFGRPAGSAPGLTPMPLGQPQPAAAQAQTAPSETQPVSDSLAFVTNKEGEGFSAGAAAVPPAELARRKAFLAKNDGTIQKCREKFNAIILRHWKASPVLREVDAELAGLNRLTALKRQYNQDHDVYSLARGCVALPELRELAQKYKARPEIWALGVQLSLDFLKATPEPIYKEVIRTVMADPELRKATNNVVEESAPHLPGAMTALISKGEDIGPLKKVMADFSVPK
jgi:hypothetical protein